MYIDIIEVAILKVAVTWGGKVISIPTLAGNVITMIIFCKDIFWVCFIFQDRSYDCSKDGVFGRTMFYIVVK
jgi:hypothetical protein